MRVERTIAERAPDAGGMDGHEGGGTLPRTDARDAPPTRDVAAVDDEGKDADAHGQHGGDAAHAGNRRRREVEQLLGADDRRLVAHPRHDDDRVLHVEVVAVVVFPAPEVHRPTAPSSANATDQSCATAPSERRERARSTSPPIIRHVEQLGDRLAAIGFIPM